MFAWHIVEQSEGTVVTRVTAGESLDLATHAAQTCVLGTEQEEGAAWQVRWRLAAGWAQRSPWRPRDGGKLSHWGKLPQVLPHALMGENLSASS